MSITATKAEPRDRWDILDFANLVFSHNSRPHDFRALLPKMYGDDVDFTPCHYLLKEDGRIAALTSALCYDIICGEDRLKVGYVGTVSTHPYRRGRGYMRACMELLHEDTEASGAQMLALCGQRQRYGYYGYSTGFSAVNHLVTRANVKKALKDVDAEGIRFEEAEAAPEGAVRLHESQPYFCVRDPGRYAQYLRSWDRRFYRVMKDDSCLGFCAEELADIELFDPEDIERVVKAWVLQRGDTWILLGLVHTAWNERLGRVAEKSGIENSAMLRVVDWPGCAEFFLKVRARCIAPLEDGVFRLGIKEIGTLEMGVEGGVPCCRMSGEPADVTLGRIAAQEFLFSTRGLYLPEKVFNWLPLPGWIPPQDGY